MSRVMIFIDNSNLFYRIGMYERDTNQPGFRLDYEKLRDKLAQGYDLIRVYLYMAKPEPRHYLNPARYQGDLKFFSRAYYFRAFTVVAFKRRLNKTEFKCPACGEEVEVEIPKEKGLDVGLAVDMVRFATRGDRGDYDVGMVVSGDGDLARAIETVFELHRGHRIINVDFGRYKNPILVRACSGEFIDLEDFIDEVSWLPVR